MAARGSDPIRRRRPAARPAPPSPDRDQPAADAGTPTGGFVALAGLAVASSGPQEQLGDGLRARSPRPKLLVGSADDRAEREADAMADAAVSRMSPTTGSGHPAADVPAEPGPTGDAPSPATGVLAALRRAPASSPTGGGAAIGLAGGEVDGATEQALQGARSSGTSLAPAVRRQYEDAFDADFGAVRVHSGPASARLNSALGARAFTLGSDIYFGDRVPDGAAATDRHLMAHELAHTLQDGGDAHRQVLRRLAVQITASFDAVKDEHIDEEMHVAEEVKEGSGPAEAHLVTDVHPVGEGRDGETGKVATAPAASGGRELFIDEVAIVGRPRPLFSGSMGDHMTAFVISRKGIENAIVDQPFRIAVREVRDIVADLPKLPGWDLVDALKPTEEALETTTGPDILVEAKDDATTPSAVIATGGPAPATALDEDAVMDTTALETGPGTAEGAAADARYQRATHHARFLSAQEALEDCQGLLEAAESEDVKVVRLQDYIAAYLELRELVPLSVSNWKGANRSRGGKGDGETGLPGLLAAPGAEQPPGRLRRDFLSTIATARLAQAAVEPNAQALAILMPGLNPALSADERTRLMARQHVQSVLTNFPVHFGALADDILSAEGQARERAEQKKAGTVKGKAPATKPALFSALDADVDFEADEGKAGGATPGRTTEEDFAIIENHLVHLVQMRYAEVAAVELKHQQHIIKLHPEDEQGAIAIKDAEALSNFLTTKPALSSTDSSAHKDEDKKEKKEEGGRGSKRDRHSETAVVDDLYGSLSPKEAKLVYTGRDLSGAGKKAEAGVAAELAVQIVLDNDGAVDRATVERQGRYTKGAHTIPWMQWLLWLNADIKGKQPAAALDAFTITTTPFIMAQLGDGSLTVEPAVLATMPSDATMVEDLLVADPVIEEAKEDVPPSESLPLVELQAAFAHLLDVITDAPDSSVLDATDTGGKGEASYRAKLTAYENGKRDVSSQELVNWILALCDVGEAEVDLAERTVKKALSTAQRSYPDAYRDSGIADEDLSDLAERAAIGKSGVFEPGSESEPDSDSDSEERERLKKKRRKSLSGRAGPGNTKGR